MKRALVIRNVNTHDIPLDSLDNSCVQVFTNNGFITEIAITHESDIRQQLLQTHACSSPFEVVLFRATGVSTSIVYNIIHMIRTISKQLFLCVYSHHFVDHPLGRYQAFEQGASMVTNAIQDIHHVMQFISSCDYQTIGISYTCPFCQRCGFTEDQLWQHCPLYHINESNIQQIQCPICLQLIHGPFQVHLHNAHGPPGRGEMMSEYRMSSTLLYSFALVVCYNKKYNTFLLVQEFANSGFWLPGGRIDNDENPIEAAIRETKEEAGIEIQITGILKMEYHPKKDRKSGNYVRMRFIFYAEPIDCDQIPKSIPDYESAGATWCPMDVVHSLPLRGSEPSVYFSYVASGQPIYPLELLRISSIHPSNTH